MRTLIYAAGLAFGLAASAQAATVHEIIRLHGNGGVGTSFDYSSGDLDLTVTAYQHSAGTLGSQISVGQWSRGLGSQFSGDSQHFVEGDGPDEMLLFSFNRVVTLERVWVGYYDRADDLELASYGTGLNLDEYKSDVALYDWVTQDGVYDGDGHDWGRTILRTIDKVTGSIIGIGADHPDDQFKVYAMRVSYDPSIPAVPLPAAGLLLLGAFGGLGIMARRRRKA